MLVLIKTHKVEWEIFDLYRFILRVMTNLWFEKQSRIDEQIMPQNFTLISPGFGRQLAQLHEVQPNPFFNQTLFFLGYYLERLISSEGIGKETIFLTDTYHKSGCSFAESTGSGCRANHVSSGREANSHL